MAAHRPQHQVRSSSHILPSPRPATGSLATLPALLRREGGYRTHLVGKWHLGYCHRAFLPNNRGFDTFFGQYNHATDYYRR